jgi:hypothetical protein
MFRPKNIYQLYYSINLSIFGIFAQRNVFFLHLMMRGHVDTKAIYASRRWQHYVSDMYYYF